MKFLEIFTATDQVKKVVDEMSNETRKQYAEYLESIPSKGANEYAQEVRRKIEVARKNNHHFTKD